MLLFLSPRRTDKSSSCDYQILRIKLFEVFYNVCTSPNLFLSNKESSYALIKYINNHLASWNCNLLFQHRMDEASTHFFLDVLSAMLPSQKQHRQLNTNTFTADKPWFGHMTVLPVFQVLAMSNLIIRDSLTRSFTLFRKDAFAKALVEAMVYNKSHPAQLRLVVLLTVLPNKLLHHKLPQSSRPLRGLWGI